MFGASHMGSASAMGPDIGKANGAATRVFKIMEYPTSIDAIALDENKETKKLDLNNVRGKIEFRNVWFRYPTRKEDFVHRGLNLVINPGESVALVGESGCGKSTFVNLMMRFYDVDEGQILLDDIDIKDMNLHDLRKAISLVMQEPIIFNYSILENILYGELKATNEQVYKAAE
jgi:ATP-binding cassette subfamily B (MDR/TAP) protein 1